MLQSIDTCENMVFADQYHIRPYRQLRFRAHRGKVTANQVLGFDWIVGSYRVNCCNQLRVIRKSLNVNPGLNVSRRINDFWIQFFFSLLLGHWFSVQLKMIKNRRPNSINRKLTAKLQNSIQIFACFGLTGSGSEQPAPGAPLLAPAKSILCIISQATNITIFKSQAKSYSD